MASFSTSEIALELLTNKFYDVEGKQHINLKDIFASCPKQPIPMTVDASSSSSLIAKLGIGEIGLVAKPDKECVAHFNDKFKNILKNSAADMQGKYCCKNILILSLSLCLSRVRLLAFCMHSCVCLYVYFYGMSPSVAATESAARQNSLCSYWSWTWKLEYTKILCRVER